MHKVLKWTCWKLWCISSCRQLISSLTSFLRYCEDNCKLAILRTLRILDRPHRPHRIDFRKLSCLSACKKSTSSVTSFLRCCKEIANLGIPGRTHLKEKYQFERLLMFTSRKKNQLHPSRFPWDIAKDIETLLLWVLWKCLATHNQSDTINLWKTFVFICWQKINFIPSVFQEILQRYANFFDYPTELWNSRNRIL